MKGEKEDDSFRTIVDEYMMRKPSAFSRESRVRRCMMGDFAFYFANEVRATKLAQANSGCGVFWKAKCMRWVDSLPQPPWPSTRVS